MPEIVLYRNQYRESGPLLAAINRLGLQNFARSRNLIITRTRFPDWFRYRKVTGFRGSYCAGRLDHWINWTIHWDYDPIKGPHVNLLIQDNFMNETLRFAYCESHGPHPYGRAPETQSHEFTLSRLTSDWLQLQLLDRYSGQEGWCGSKCIPGKNVDDEDNRCGVQDLELDERANLCGKAIVYWELPST
jgi:hypothetical protein